MASEKVLRFLAQARREREAAAAAPAAAPSQFEAPEEESPGISAVQGVGSAAWDEAKNLVKGLAGIPEWMLSTVSGPAGALAGDNPVQFGPSMYTPAGPRQDLPASRLLGGGSVSGPAGALAGDNPVQFGPRSYQPMQVRRGRYDDRLEVPPEPGMLQAQEAASQLGGQLKGAFWDPFYQGGEQFSRSMLAEDPQKMGEAVGKGLVDFGALALPKLVGEARGMIKARRLPFGQPRIAGLVPPPELPPVEAAPPAVPPAPLRGAPPLPPPAQAATPAVPQGWREPGPPQPLAPPVSAATEGTPFSRIRAEDMFGPPPPAPQGPRAGYPQLGPALGSQGETIVPPPLEPPPLGFSYVPRYPEPETSIPGFGYMGIPREAPLRGAPPIPPLPPGATPELPPVPSQRTYAAELVPEPPLRGAPPPVDVPFSDVPQAQGGSAPPLTIQPEPRLGRGLPPPKPPASGTKRVSIKAESKLSPEAQAFLRKIGEIPEEQVAEAPSGSRPTMEEVRAEFSRSPGKSRQQPRTREEALALPKKSAESAEKVLLDVALESAIPPEILGAQSRARGSRGKGRKAARKKGPASEEPAGFGPIEGAAPPLPPSPSPPEGPNLLPGVSPLNKAERIRSTGELLRGKIDLPQFGGYADRAGAVEGTAKSFAAARRKHNALLDETFGENPTERLGKMARWLEDNPEGAQIPMKMREAPGSLTPAETALSRSPEFDKAGWQSFYRSLNRTRVQGLDEGWLGGDRGPNYFPRQVESVGHLLEVLGPDWRKKLLTPEGRALVLGNLQRSRLGDLVGDANAGVIAANYIRQVAEADTVQPWSKHFVETIKELADEGNTKEAQALLEYFNANVSRSPSVLDSAVVEQMLQQVADAPPLEPGAKFEVKGSTGGGLPAGQYLVLESKATGAGPMVRLARDGVQSSAWTPEFKAQAARLGRVPIPRRPVTSWVNAMNWTASLWRIGSNVRTALLAMRSNTARLLSKEGLRNLREGFRSYRRGMKDPVKLREWQEQGVFDRTLRSITENPDDFRAMTKAENLFYWSTRMPDQFARILAYEARKRGFLADGIPEIEARDKASIWAATVSDISVEGFRSPMQAHPIGKLFAFLQTSKLREFQLLESRIKAGDYKAAGKQVAINGSILAALVYAAGGDTKDFWKGIVEFIPGADAMTGGNVIGVSSIDIAGGVVQNLARGNLYGAAPTVVQQAVDVAQGQPGRLLHGVRRKARAKAGAEDRGYQP